MEDPVKKQTFHTQKNKKKNHYAAFGFSGLRTSPGDQVARLDAVMITQPLITP